MFFEYEKERPKLLDEETIKDPLGRLYIPRGLWQDMINSYEKEEVLNRLRDLINRGIISFPYQHYSKEDVLDEFQRLKKSEASFSHESVGE